MASCCCDHHDIKTGSFSAGVGGRGRVDFLGSPVVRTQGFHCHEPRFSHWLGN